MNHFQSFTASPNLPIFANDVQPHPTSSSLSQPRLTSLILTQHPSYTLTQPLTSSPIFTAIESCIKCTRDVIENYWSILIGRGPCARVNMAWFLDKTFCIQKNSACADGSPRSRFCALWPSQHQRNFFALHVWRGRGQNVLAISGDSKQWKKKKKEKTSLGVGGGLKIFPDPPFFFVTSYPMTIS